MALNPNQPNHQRTEAELASQLAKYVERWKALEALATRTQAQLEYSEKQRQSIVDEAATEFGISEPNELRRLEAEIRTKAYEDVDRFGEKIAEIEQNLLEIGVTF